MTSAPERLASALSDRYRVERELGSGGMATVYLAEDLKHHRKVALKVLRPELAAALGPDRFLREIEIAARLTHPHILPLYDSGESGGFLHYVMPYVEGEPLRGRLTREKQLPVEDALQIARNVAAALSYAHSHDVVHRDIKPENILLSGGEAVVADFGIARAISAAGGEQLTETGVSIGTPAYMSPEQAAGSPDLDGRSDIYALGCVLYEMLAGQPPFTGPTVESVVHQHLTAAPPRVTAIRAAVPQQVEGVLHKTLAKAPGDRYATAAELATILTDVAVATTRSTVGTQETSPAEKSIAVLPFTNMSADPENEYFADGMTEEIINALTQLKDLRVAARTSSFAFKGKTPDLADVGARLKVATVLEGSVRKAGIRLRITAQLVNVADGYHLWSERYDREMADVFAIQDEIAKAIADKLQVTLVAGVAEQLVRRPTENLEAYDLYLKGRFFVNMGGESPLKGLEYLEQALACDPEYALAHAGIADAFNFSGDVGILRPREAKPKAREAAMRALELDETLAEAHAALGWCNWTHDFEWSNAERHLLRAIELNPELAEARFQYGFFLSSMGRFEESLAELRHGVNLDPLAQLGNTWLGQVLAFLEQFPAAIDQLRAAVELDPTSWHANHMVGMVYRLNSDYPEAIEALQTAMALAGRQPWSLMELALTHAASGSKAQAEAIFDELVARSRGEYVSPATLSFVSAALGREDEAFEWLERAYEERDPFLIWVKQLPHFDPIRGDPRFDVLLEKMGLE